MTSRSPVRADLISSLDEKYVANSLIFASMHAAGTLIVDATTLRASDGTLDRSAIRARVDRLSWFAPAMRQRLCYTPLRATTPAWVPVDELDLEYHVRFHSRVEPDDPAHVEVLTGRAMPTMDISHPLWDFLFVELDSGRVAIVVRYHHVVGDAMYGLRIGDVLAGTVEAAALPQPGPAERHEVGVAPRTGFGILRIAWRDWYARHDSPAAAWHGYWRKSLRMRLRRWAGRSIRPLRNARIARSGMASTLLGGRSSRYFVTDLAAATKRAYRLGGTLSDLTVAATLRAVADQRPGARTVSMLVPISRRALGDAKVRNAISVVKVTVPAEATLEQMVPSVRKQVQFAVDAGGSVVEGADQPVGYSTYVTWGRDQRYFGAAPLETVTGWPAGDPRDEVACLACAYRRDLVVSATVRDTIDLAAFMASVEHAIAVTPVFPPVGGRD